MAEDPFEDVLNLEDQFYQDGYNQGMEDGERAGKIEGRAFGLEKGFEKFLQSGRLHGKSVVWANRLALKQQTEFATHPAAAQTTSREDTIKGGETPRLPQLPSNAKLERNIASLQAFVEPESLSTENTDESVNDFDDRLKKAQGKAKIVERMLGEEAVRDTAMPEENQSSSVQSATSAAVAAAAAAAAAAARTDW